MTKIQEAILRLKDHYGSYRKLEVAIGINYAYLQRLGTEERIDPSNEVLAKLGLERRVTYVWKRNGRA